MAWQALESFFRDFRRDCGGISSVEYALLLAVVAGGIVLALNELSDAVDTQLNQTADCIDGTRTPQEC